MELFFFFFEGVLGVKSFSIQSARSFWFLWPLREMHRWMNTAFSVIISVPSVFFTTKPHPLRGGGVPLDNPTKHAYLVRTADQFEDVHLWMRLSVVCQQRVQMLDGRQGAVLIRHVVQVSATKRNVPSRQPGDTPPRFATFSPAQHRHGLAVVLAAQQLVDVGVQHGERQLEDHLDAVEKKAVHHHHGALERHDRQEEREEPGERDGGDDAEVLHTVVKLRHVLAGQLQ